MIIKDELAAEIARVRATNAKEPLNAGVVTTLDIRIADECLEVLRRLGVIK